MTRVDLNELECYLRQHYPQTTAPAAFTLQQLYALVAELRAARQVVDAAGPVTLKAAEQHSWGHEMSRLALALAAYNQPATFADHNRQVIP